MDEKFDDHASLLSRIQLLERERDELRNDIEQMCMQHAGPSYAAVATRMHFQRTAGLEQEIGDLKKKLTACLRQNANLQEELSEAYRIKNQLADLHATEVSKSMEAEKQIKFFQSCVAAAFSERDNAIMEAEKAKEKEEVTSQKFDIMQQRIEELNSIVLEEKKLSATLQTDLQKQEKDNEIFKKVISKFYEIRQHSLNEYDDINWEERCNSLLNDSEDMWTLTDQGETSNRKYITTLEEEVEALRKSVINLRSKLKMGLEIEKHLKKMVHDLKSKKIRLEEKMKEEISGLRSFYSEYRLDIMNFLDEESSHLKSTVNVIEENIRELYINGEQNHLSPQGDVTLQESDCRDVHINPDTDSDIVTKENVSGSSNTSTSEAEDGSEAISQTLKEKENFYDLQKASTSGFGDASKSLAQALQLKENFSELQKTSTSGLGDASEPLAQALQEKVAALLLLSQQEERYLLDSNVNAALQNKVNELQRNLIQVTNEKVVALMELAQLKQEYRLLKEKVEDDVKQGKPLADIGGKKMIQDKDGKLKSMLKKTYFHNWLNPIVSHESEAGPHQEYAQNIVNRRSNNAMDFARMKIEYAALKESLESMEHLTSSIHRLRLSLVKVKESIPAEDTITSKSEIIKNVITEAKLLKTALGSSLPLSWSAEEDNVVSNDSKVDCVSAAGFEMVELLILSSQLLNNSIIIS